MKQNIGVFDRTIRILFAAILAILYFTGTVTGSAGIVFLLLAAILLITAITRFCGLYKILGVTSCKRKDTDAQ